MAGPWEKYQQTNANQVSGPWQKYQGATPAPEAPITNEAADVGFMDRFTAKNFSNSPESAAKYIQKQYPSAKVKVADGEVVVQQPGSNEFRKLDPTNYDPTSAGFWKDLPADLGDMAYDLVSAPVQTAGAAGGAALGTLAAPGAGTVAGGIAGSAAASAGSEAFRQKLGQMLGIDQEVNGRDVAWAGGLGAGGAALLGTGATKGAIQAGYGVLKNKLAPKTLQAMSGIDSDVIKHYASNTDVVDQLINNGITSYVTPRQQAARRAVDDAITSKGVAVKNAIDDAGQQVNVSEAKQAFIQQISDLQAKGDLTNVEAAQLRNLKQAYSQVFGISGKQGTTLADELDAGRAFDLQKNLKRFAAFDTNMTPETAVVQAPSQQAYRALNEAFDQATSGASTEAKKNYSQMLDLDNLIGTKMDDPQKFYQMATGLDTKSRRILAEKLRAAGVNDPRLDMSDTALTLKAYDAFANPAMNAMSSGGTTSTSRTIPLAIGGGAVGTAVGLALGNPVLAGMLGLVGAKAGAVAASPAAVKAAVKGGKLADKAISQAAGMLPPELLNPALTRGLLQYLEDQKN